MAEVSLDDVMRAVADLRCEMQSEIAELKRALAVLQAEQAAKTAAETPAELSPELLVIMAAAVTAYLGVKVKIRSARLVQPSLHETASPWAQHGRVFVQAASHSLRHVR